MGLVKGSIGAVFATREGSIQKRSGFQFIYWYSNGKYDIHSSLARNSNCTKVAYWRALPSLLGILNPD